MTKQHVVLFGGAKMRPPRPPTPHTRAAKSAEAEAHYKWKPSVAICVNDKSKNENV